MNLAFGRPWTPDEDAVVRADYAKKGAAAVAKALDRSVKSVQKRAARNLGVFVKCPWAAEEDEQLSKLWGLHSTRTIALRLGRSSQAVYVRAAVNGLVERERVATEKLEDAAARVGYDRRDLKRILRRAGVLRESISRNAGNRPRPSYQLDPFEVDEAVREYVRSSPMIVAARARGVSDHKLRRALERIGIKRPEILKPNEQWRISDELADRALGLDGRGERAETRGRKETSP